jgi:hypothetical protein
MTGSMGRIWRRMTGQSIMPFMMLVVVVNPPTPTDPNRRTTGYGGVLPIPAPAPATASTPRPDPVVETANRETRISRGRVLYASRRTPHEAQTPQRVEAKQPQCERRVVQGKAPAASPNS